MSMVAPLPPTWTAGYPVEVDWPQTGAKDPPGYHEAIWTWGYDPASRVGYYLYLLHDQQDETLRQEIITLYLPDGSLLRGAAKGRGSAGRTAAGENLALTCIAPFQTWETRYRGELTPIAWDAQAPEGQPVPVDLAFTMQAGAPAWNVEGDWGEARPNMRFHQLYRLTDGELALGDKRLPLGGATMRGHSRRERDLSKYTGHVVATALFDSGRAFGMFCFFGQGLNLKNPHGYVVIDGVLHEAILEEIPPIRRKQRAGEALRFVLAGAFGRVVVTGETLSTTFVVRDEGPQAGLATSMGIARYEWDGEVAYGPIDRCHAADMIEGLGTP